MMKLAIPIRRNRISPVLDYASQVKIVDVGETNDVRGAMTVNMPDAHPAARVNVLKDLGVDVVICGAVSMPLMQLIRSEGITVIPGIAGEAVEIQQAYLEGSAIQDRFPMPGCGRGRRRKHRRGRRCNRERRIR
jgi:predicted Fe-Mo cluster-binding NifX family protein